MERRFVTSHVSAGVAHILLDRPEKLNALGMGPTSNRTELVEALEEADADPNVCSILLSAEGRAFCAGGDLLDAPRMETPLERDAFVKAVTNMNARVRAISKPLIGAVHGLCLGAGVGLVAQCDFVIAAEDACFGLPEGRFGHPGAIEIIPLVGAMWAKFLILTGELIDATVAERIGLLLETTSPEQLLDRSRDLASRLARMPSASTILNKAAVDSYEDAAGRTAGRTAGKARDTITASMSSGSQSPDGRNFREILQREGIVGLRDAQRQQYTEPWLRSSSRREK